MTWGASMLDPIVAGQLQQAAIRLRAADAWPEPSVAHPWRDTLRARFDPTLLARLSDAATLALFDQSDPHSLMAWLARDDDDLARLAGGARVPLDTGLVRRAETGAWLRVTHSAVRPVSPWDAADIAVAWRDQLLVAAQLLALMPADADDALWQQCAQQLRRAAPDVADTTWGHRYLECVVPDRLSLFHTAMQQWFYLIKLWQVPLTSVGRYGNAGRWSAIARHLSWSIRQLCHAVAAHHGAPHAWWCISPRVPLTPAAVRLSDAPPISRTLDAGGRRDRIARGDTLAVVSEMRVVAIGTVAAMPSDTLSDPQHRRVEWWDGEFGGLMLPASAEEVCEIQSPEALIAIERARITPPPVPAALPPPLADILERLARRGQMILYGPQGTGKRYWAAQAAREHVARAWCGLAFSQLTPEQQQVITGAARDDGLVRVCRFHPSYGYADFIEGYRPMTTYEGAASGLRSGIFKQLCDEAAAHAGRPYVLVIEDINRGDLPQIFGDVLRNLDREQRDQSVTLPLSGVAFMVPANVAIIGTMDATERVMALLDATLRRRFAFLEIMPSGAVLANTHIAGLDLGRWLDRLNERVRRYFGPDAVHAQIGQGCFMADGRPVETVDALARVLGELVIPSLEERCYADYGMLAGVLGPRLVDRAARRVRYELLAPAGFDALPSILLAMDREVRRRITDA